MRSLVAAALVLAVLGGAWWLTRDRSAEAPPAGDQQAVAPPADQTPVAPPAVGTPPPAGEPPFRDRLRDFVASASELPEAERAAQAEALRRDTLAREADGSLLPAESAYIQLALLRATISDQALLQRRSEELLLRYETASRQGWEEYRRRPDPRHEAYRAAEAELIRGARQDGVSEAELREQLQALREQYFD